jgi:hypothetical protein
MTSPTSRIPSWIAAALALLVLTAAQGGCEQQQQDRSAMTVFDAEQDCRGAYIAGPGVIADAQTVCAGVGAYLDGQSEDEPPPESVLTPWALEWLRRLREGETEPPGMPEDWDDVEEDDQGEGEGEATEEDTG